MDKLTKESRDAALELIEKYGATSRASRLHLALGLVLAARHIALEGELDARLQAFERLGEALFTGKTE